MDKVTKAEIVGNIYDKMNEGAGYRLPRHGIINEIYEDVENLIDIDRYEIGVVLDSLVSVLREAEKRGDKPELRGLDLGPDKATIRNIIDLFLGEVKECLKNNATIELRGFGTFEVKIRQGKSRARNPKTGEFVVVEKHGVASFRAGKELKEDVWDIT